MLNKAPIFVNGFSRGGTNVIVNLIASHPDVCLVSGETHEVFYGNKKKPVTKWIRRLFGLPIVIAARQHIFWPHRYYDRNRIPRFMMYYVDLLLFWGKVTATENVFKWDGVKYSVREKRASRLLGKNAMGVVLATDVFSEMYPDATFLALVRNGLALCEGYVRRGLAAKQAGELYDRVCKKIIYDATRIDNYHVVRFEHMISDPASFVRKAYKAANLDLTKVPKFRLQAKRVMTKEGAHDYTFGSTDRELRWFTAQEIETYLHEDVDENQIARLSVQDRREFLQQAGESMEYFGYL